MSYVVQITDEAGEWQDGRRVTAKTAAEVELRKVPVTSLPARVIGLPDREEIARRDVPQAVVAGPDPLAEIRLEADAEARHKARKEELVASFASRGFSERELAAAAGVSPPTAGAIIDRVNRREAAKQDG